MIHVPGGGENVAPIDYPIIGPCLVTTDQAIAKSLCEKNITEYLSVHLNHSVLERQELGVEEKAPVQKRRGQRVKRPPPGLS